MVFHKFSQIAGRIVPSTSNMTYMPQGLQPASAENAAFTFESSATRKVKVGASFSGVQMTSGSSAAVEPPKGIIPSTAAYKNVVKLQNLLTANDGLLVWQKRGMRDKIPLLFTAAVIVVGMVIATNTIYKMGMPKKQQE